MSNWYDEKHHPKIITIDIFMFGNVLLLISLFLVFAILYLVLVEYNEPDTEDEFIDDDATDETDGFTGPIEEKPEMVDESADKSSVEQPIEEKPIKEETVDELASGDEPVTEELMN